MTLLSVVLLVLYAVLVTVILIILNEKLHSKMKQNEHLRKTIGDIKYKKYQEKK